MNKLNTHRAAEKKRDSLNLLIVIHSLQCGGAERVTANLANYWASFGWQVTILTLAPVSDDFYSLDTNVQRISLNMSGKSKSNWSSIVENTRRIRALRRTLKQARPDIALAMMSTANVLLAIAAMCIKDTTLIGSERVHPPNNPIGAIWSKLRTISYANLDAIVTLTEESARWLRRHTYAHNIRVIPNFAQWPLPVLPPHVSTKIHLRKHHVLLAIGRLDEQKGFNLLVSTFAGLAGIYKDWQLVILGDGPQMEALLAQVDSIGLTDRISLPGRVGNIGQWYEAADLFVMSSLFEGFPNTLVEAMAYGLPVVSFDCDTGPSDIIRHEVDGLLVPAGSISALTTALHRLMGSESLRRQYGTRAMDVRERFSIHGVSGMWEALFYEIRHGQ